MSHAAVIDSSEELI